MLNLVIRQETENDQEAVYEIVKAAFENAEHTNGDEQNLVNRLRKSEAFIPELSLVAEREGKLVGHILFTKAKIGAKLVLAIAPLAVLPESQGQGIGKKLILTGHEIAKQLGFGAVILVGHPTYYPRFGYIPASKWGIKAPFEVPDECFMALELFEDSLKDVSGIFEHAKEFFEEQ